MKISLDCIPCFVRQALEAARFVSDDPAIHEQIVRDVLRTAAEMDLSESPPVVGQRIHRRLRELTGVADPYRAVKDRFNVLAANMMPDLSAKVRASSDPLSLAVRLAIAGNVIDLGVNGRLTEEQVRQAVAQTLREPFHGDIGAFRQGVAGGGTILYLADNAGEIFFDRLLIGQLPAERITVAVRGSAIINDATMVDAEAAGLRAVAEVIDNGSDAPGTILHQCSENFRTRFAEADVIIAKGQGNFETLSGENADIFFLFKVKCPVIADHIGLPVGTHVLISSRAGSVLSPRDEDPGISCFERVQKKGKSP